MTKIRKFLHFNAWTLLLDILAVNAAYFGALIVRFFVAFRLSPSIGNYMEMFFRFTPFYTVMAIAVFFFFRLYGGMWVYAGLNDMNRIICANAITALIHVVGTLLSVGRMPISYYLIGAFLQFLFICIIRFGYRFINMEKKRIEKNRQERVPAFVVGSGDYGRKALSYLEDNTVFKPVAIVGTDGGRSMNGVPGIPMEALEEQIKSKGIKAVFIADESLTHEQREAIRKAAGEIMVKDYTGYLTNLSGSLPVSSVLEVAQGPVTLMVKGKTRQFATAEEALSTLTQRYEVKRISTPLIELEKGTTDESWIQEYSDETGEDVSFF